MVNATGEDISYNIFNIRFEVENGGYATIWFNLDGPAFETPEAMENMFVDFDSFLEYLKRQEPELIEALGNDTKRHETLLERLELSDLDWNEHLRRYLEMHVDLKAAEKERLEWLHSRKARLQDPDTRTAEADWLALSAQAEPSKHPSWDDVAHAIITSLNETTVSLYPEVLDFSPENNARLREIFESHGERLANQLYALTRLVREEQ
ncbi:MAG: hypothetical protein IPK76_25175 [Lewinellaceae bacterium]|jgi:hypothetical protein|nr:hypothetical protein [Lewinellaceae bacterium]